MPLQNNIEENYHNLINNNEYVSYNYGDTTRYYLTINGIISNQFFDVAINNNSQVGLSQNYEINGAVTVLPMVYRYDTLIVNREENYIVYIVKNNIATPVLISYMTVTNEDGATYSEAICRNLNNGEYIDYGEINYNYGGNNEHIS